MSPTNPAIGKTLHLIEGLYSIIQLGKGEEIPKWAVGSPYVSITRTDDELSIVCLTALVPPKLNSSDNWRILKVKEVLDLSLTGILSSILIPLAEGGVPVFTISTFNTDYILVKETVLSKAAELLKEAGFVIES